MGDHPCDRLPQKGQVERVRHGKPERVNDVVPGQALQSGEYLSGKIKVRLAEHPPSGVIGVAVMDAKTVFKNKSE
jgi:hypothetical protein